ncbi:DUF1565 domain-containing protein [candidate division KSB3 bacterium]|uniref:DUF1565 domain-containing protein n=1 Tax=candidate division KSB3 bacterium TaxID=2044937 RepID=A0A9D5JY22_9BACT|nr:DUF1565 domain-containing protein [candidate division KSB3 bacterium]MBD3326348.1 DUF1565 domain-containing protein [candidate division KSB3 bacterium]
MNDAIIRRYCLLFLLGLLLSVSVGCDSDSNVDPVEATAQGPTAGPNRMIEVPGDYPLIQQAIEAADNGDFIWVAAGVYAENLRIIAKNISLRGVGPGASIVQGSVRFVDTSESSFEGFRVIGEGMYVSRSPIRISGNEILDSPTAGLWVDHCPGVLISDNTISNSGQEGLVIDDSSGVIGSNQITGNRTDGVVINNSSPTLQQNVISGNQRDGLSIHGVTAHAAPLLISNTFEENGTGSHYDIICFGNTNPTGVGNRYERCLNCAECRSFDDPVTYLD